MSNIEDFTKLMDQWDRSLDDTLIELKVYTLGKLLKELKSVSNKKLPVQFSSKVNGVFSPFYYHSYRGYYRCVSLGCSMVPITVHQLIWRTELAIGNCYTGWKGGEYLMTASTPVWVAEEGDNTGIAIIGFEQTSDKIILKIENIEKKLDVILDRKLDEFQASQEE